MKNFKKGWFALAGALIVIGLMSVPLVGTGFAQQDTGSISGTIIEDATGISLSGANVVIVGSNLGAATDASGNFQIVRVPTGQSQLQVSFIGYKSITMDVTVIVNQETTADFALAIDPLKTEAVVVTGIASRTSKSVAEVAVQRVAVGEMVDQASYTTVDNLLLGKVAGVSVQKGEGNFGASFRMNVRSGAGLAGNGQPVFYVDGIKIENTNWRGGGEGSGRYGGGGVGISSLLHLDPNDIENIEVIKGPAGASSYGTGGSNGVVLITTKRGKFAGQGGTGKNWSINYKNTVGYHDQPQEYKTNGKTLRYPDALNKFFKKGQIVRNALSLSAGSESTRLYASFDKADEVGITPRNNINQTNLRANIDFFPSEKFNLSIGTQYNNAELQTYGRGRYAGMFAILSEFRDWNGAWGLLDDTYFDGEDDRNFITNYIGSVSAEYTPFAGGSEWLRPLSARFSFGVDDKNNRNTYNNTPRSAEIYGWGHEGSRSISQRRSRTATYSGDVRYGYELFGINATSTIGAQMFNERVRIISAEKELFDNPALMEIEAGNNYSSAAEISDHFRSAGLFTEHSLSYQDTYFGSFMIRKDYASVMGAEESSVFYPRGSLAVRLDKFDFLPSYLPFLKVRTAYGETGILPGRLDGIPELWGTNTSPYGIGGVLADVGNRAIKPERIKEWESGIEAEFSNYALEFNYYKQWAKDGLVRKSLVGSSGKTVGTRMFNLGEVEGSGYELQLMANYAGRQLGGWRFNLSTSVSYQENKIVNLAGGEPVAGGPGGGKQYYWEGFPKMSFYNVQNEGAKFSDGTNVQENGDHPLFGEVMPEGVMYGDLASSEVFNADGSPIYPDGGRVFRGTGTPEYIGHFSATIDLFDFTLYGLFQFKTGFFLYNESRWNQQGEGIWSGAGWINTEYGTNNPGYGTMDYDHDVLVQLIGWGDTGTGVEPLTPGTQAYVDAANRYARYNIAHDANFIEPGDFLRLQELSLTYNLDNLIRKTGMSNYIQGLKLGVAGSNLWLLTKDAYHGFDPEINSMGFGDYDPQNSMQAGTIPPPKTLTMYVRVIL